MVLPPCLAPRHAAPDLAVRAWVSDQLLGRQRHDRRAGLNLLPTRPKGEKGAQIKIDALSRRRPDLLAEFNAEVS